MKLDAAVAAIEKNAVLLVYPVDNRKEPLSLRSVFHPRTPMRWEWDEEGDDRVADLWRLRTELSSSGRVVYAKWYRGRATFFSRSMFTAILAVSRKGATDDALKNGLSRTAHEILALFETDLPLSTKEVKALSGLRGKPLEAIYEKAMKELWSRFLVVGFGERDDGAFPSLLMGATKLIFEDLWEESKELSAAQGWEIIEQRVFPDSLFLKCLRKNLC